MSFLLYEANEKMPAECNEIFSLLTQRNIFQILLIQTKFGLLLPISDRFSTKQNSDWY